MDDAAYETLLVERRDNVAWVTLDRPAALNTFSLRLADELHDLFGMLRDDVATRVVVLTGAGRAFCAGLDIKESATGAHRDAAPGGGGFAFQGRLSDICVRMRACPQPIVGLINGPAFGGGMGLALSCDLRIAAASARFGVAAIRIGLSGCDFGMSYFLPRMIGSARAAELLMTGRTIDADRALALGLVSEVVADGALAAAGQAMVDDLLLASPVGLRLTKDALNAAIDAPGLEAALAMENRNQLLAGKSDDFAEARRAFLEKRRPVFTGR